MFGHVNLQPSLVSKSVAEFRVCWRMCQGGAASNERKAGCGSARIDSACPVCYDEIDFIAHLNEAQPAMRKPTIQDVAREAGTSVSTVSRVLTGNTPVSPDKRRAIEEAVERLGFSPSQVARSLRMRATHTISL